VTINGITAAGIENAPDNSYRCLRNQSPMPETPNVSPCEAWETPLTQCNERFGFQWKFSLVRSF
jgi:hypothetical protein